MKKLSFSQITESESPRLIINSIRGFNSKHASKGKNVNESDTWNMCLWAQTLTPKDFILYITEAWSGETSWQNIGVCQRRILQMDHVHSEKSLAFKLLLRAASLGLMPDKTSYTIPRRYIHGDFS